MPGFEGPQTTTQTGTVRLMLSRRARRIRKAGSFAGKTLLMLITSLSIIAVFFIFYFIAKDAIPFFQSQGIREFFTSTRWYPSAASPEFGVLAILVGSGLVTLGAVLVSVPLGISAAVCMSDVLSFQIRQLVKPVIEVLAAIPSVAYGFFALVVFAPALQDNGNLLLSIAAWMILTPLMLIGTVILADLLKNRFFPQRAEAFRILLYCIMGIGCAGLMMIVQRFIFGLVIGSGTNALNVSIILGIMALPTIISVSEDALQACGRELREGSYALGATRAETIVKTVIPASVSGILAAVILGVMRAFGETMVVWMASGNSAQIPSPIFNFLSPVRTLTATIAGDMGEADHVTGSARYHVLFAMALCLLFFSFAANTLSEWVVRIQHKRLGKS